MLVGSTVAGCHFDDALAPGLQNAGAVLVVRGDSILLLNGSMQFSAETPGIPDVGPRKIDWASSDSTIVSVDEQGVVHARRIGSATLVVTLTAPDLVVPLTRSWPVRVTYASIAVDPIDSLTGLGERRTVVVRGLDVFGTPVSAVPAVLESRDTTIVSVVRGEEIGARGEGVATVVATHGEQRDSIPVRVRRVAARASFTAPTVVLRAIGRDTVVPLRVRDTNDSLMAAPSIRWTSSDPTAIGVSPDGTFRALRAAPAILTAQVDTVSATLGVTVDQTVAELDVARGDGQIGTVGSSVPIPPSIVVRDGAAHPIAGVEVVFSVSEGGGAITDSIQTTDPEGIATVGSWTLGTRPGVNRLLARVGGLVTAISATAGIGSVDPATSEIVVARDSVTAGDTTIITLYARDTFGNPIATGGATVTFNTSGGTSTGQVGATIDFGDGTYAATFTARKAGSPTTVTATIDGDPVSSLRPSVTVIPGPPARVAVLAGDGQVAAAGTSVAIAPVVGVFDVLDNPVSGILVSFTPTTGDGVVTGAVQTSDQLGRASVTVWTLGSHAGENRLTVTAQALTATITATGVAGPASLATSQIVVTSGDALPAGTSTPITLRTYDRYGNPLTAGGLDVRFALSGGTSTGVLSPVTDNGNGLYQASFTGIGAGTALTVGATLNGDAITSPLPSFAVIPGPPSRMELTAGDGQEATVGTAVPVAPTVSLSDALGNRIAGAVVTFEVTGGGGSVTGETRITDPAGRASVHAWTLGPTAGENLLTAVAQTVHATFAATGTPGPASPTASFVLVPQDTVAVGETVDVLLQTYDAFGNRTRLGGARVRFFLEGGTSGGTFAPTIDRGDGTYIAAITGGTPGTPSFVRALVGDVEATTPAPTLTVRGQGTRWKRQ